MPYKDPAARRAYYKQWQQRNLERFREYNRKHYAKNREAILARMRTAYGPSPTAPCEICGQTTKLHWDHDHATNEFRGWLCPHCNWLLGHAKDNPTTLRRAADYLETHAATTNPPNENSGRTPDSDTSGACVCIEFS